MPFSLGAQTKKHALLILSLTLLHVARRVFLDCVGLYFTHMNTNKQNVSAHFGPNERRSFYAGNNWTQSDGAQCTFVFSLDLLIIFVTDKFEIAASLLCLYPSR